MTPSKARTALITGASRGLGLALARELARQGWNLIIDARGAEALEAARAELAQHTNVTAIAGDISNPAHRRALKLAARAAGGLDAIVNNAGVLGPSPQPKLLDYSLDVLEEVYHVNVIAQLGLLQAVRHDLKPGARVVNVTSDAGVQPYEGWGGYGSSKAAFEQLSAILAVENPMWRVYWVDPGDMRTKMHQAAYPGEDISDRPLPEASVPGFIELLTGDLPSGRYQARSLRGSEPVQGVKELRVALAVDDFDEAVRFYRDGLGLPVVGEWDRSDGRGMLLATGRGVLELLDRKQAESIDQIELGQRASEPIRLAMEVPDVETSTAALRARGAAPLHDPVLTPWSHLNVRFQAPEGMQLTLFQPQKEKS